jgi:cytidine deaminase
MSIAKKVAVHVRNELSPDEYSLCQTALDAAKKAFAPLSGFAVGVAMKCENGQEFTGQNQENLAFQSIHAEIAALVNWNAAGEPPVTDIAIVGFRFAPRRVKTIIVTPCGSCRQWMYEAFARSGSNPKIICSSGDLKSFDRFQIKDLLPCAFAFDEGKAIFDAWYAEQQPKLQNL